MSVREYLDSMLLMKREQTIRRQSQRETGGRTREPERGKERAREREREEREREREQERDRKREKEREREDRVGSPQLKPRSLIINGQTLEGVTRHGAVIAALHGYHKTPAARVQMQKKRRGGGGL
jgi:hypothetical protein